MNESVPEVNRWKLLGRACAMLVAAVVLATGAIVSQPRASTAHSRDGADWLDREARWPLLGELVSPGYLVRVYAAPEGSVYTVCEPDGRVLQSDLTAAEVARVFPDLDLGSTDSTDGGLLLMQVETDDH